MKTVDSFRIHNIKCWPEPFAALERGDKTCEVRKNDRNYRVGDVLVINEYYPDATFVTGCTLTMLVTHITTGFGLPGGLVVMSVRPVKLKDMRCESCGRLSHGYDDAHTHCEDCL